MSRTERLIISLALLGTAALSSACGGADPPVERPLLSEDGAGEEGPRATHYGNPVDLFVPTQEEQDLLDRFGAGSCSRDPRLTFAARRHAMDLARGGHPDQETGIDHIRFALLSAGCGDYSIEPISIKINPDGLASLGRFIRDNGDRWSHCGLGIGKASDGDWAVLIGIERKVDLDSVPILSTAGSSMDVTGKCRTSGTTMVQAFLGMPDGSVIRPDTTVSVAGNFITHVELTAPGRYDLEIQTDSGSGLETAVLLPLYVEVDPEPLPVITPDAALGEGDNRGEDTLLRLINGTRKKAGAPKVIRDPRLDAIASSHSADMVALSYFGHRSPKTGMLADRLKANNMFPQLSAENVARSGSLLRAHRNLVQSPSHRIKVTDPTFTHVGLGVARDGGDVVITEIFARW